MRFVGAALALSFEFDALLEPDRHAAAERKNVRQIQDLGDIFEA